MCADSCRRWSCAIAVFVPAILFNFFILLFPLTGIVMMIEGDFTAGIITLIIGGIFFFGSLLKTIFPLIRVFCNVDVEEIVYRRCCAHITCCGGCCIAGGGYSHSMTRTQDLVYRGSNGTSISFADGSGRVFTISRARNASRVADVPEREPLPVPPLAKSQNAIISECIICYDEHRKIAFIPCGHVVCEECINKLDTWVCLVCRQEVTTLVRLYQSSSTSNAGVINVAYSAEKDGTDTDSVAIQIYKTCLLCQENTPNAVFFPCGHVVTCTSCMKEHSPTDCPECNIKIESITEVFL